MKRNKKIHTPTILFVVLVAVSLFIGIVPGAEDKINSIIRGEKAVISLEKVPDFSGKPFVEINGNIPVFDNVNEVSESFETYGERDVLGRCTAAFALIGRETMPDEERESIAEIIPTGFKNREYDFIEGGYVYNRCHLIGFQLTGENANTRNLITGTRYMNVEGMLPFENMIADYVKETQNHVLYRVTPIFDGNDLVARGVQLEAKSIEDKGKGICFNVYVYNNQPGIIINYSNGKSARAGEELPDNDLETEYILNTNSKKFHTTDCSGAKNISPKNKTRFKGDRDELISQGYSPCGTCDP